MRFVMACEKGHVSDIPWNLWAHTDPKTPEQKQCRSLNLIFESVKGHGTGLRSLSIKCLSCGAFNNLGGLTNRQALLRFRCPGTQPWQKQDTAVVCEAPRESLRAIQRGASNLYFATVASALDIPPESDYDPYGELTRRVTNHKFLPAILEAPEGPLVDQLKSMLINTLQSEGVDLTSDQLDAIIDNEVTSRTGRVQPVEDPDDLLSAEWHAFITDRKKRVDERSTFISEHVELLRKEDTGAVASSLSARIDKVVLGQRLREVRALQGFSRLSPDGPLVDSRLDNHDIDWLPGAEFFGEGIFFSLVEERVAQWENHKTVKTRFDMLLERMSETWKKLLPSLSPRFVLLHTLAHALIRQLSFSTGYPMASISERIYARPADSNRSGQAGILVYTAQGDTEGTLGGLVRLGRPPFFADTLTKALARSAWCSSDPVCGESQGQGMKALNLAACHACALIPETSCKHRNLLLDRMMLIHEEYGFFTETLTLALQKGAKETTGQ